MPCAGRKRHAMCSKPRRPISANGLRFEKFADEDAGSRNALKHLLRAREEIKTRLHERRHRSRLGWAAK